MGFLNEAVELSHRFDGIIVRNSQEVRGGGLVRDPMWAMLSGITSLHSR